MRLANSNMRTLLPLPSGEGWGEGAAFRTSPTARRLPLTTKPAFTLVELLVSITILSILASLVLFALAGVEESAKRDKTIATIRKLNTLVMAKYESYRTRRIPITIPPGRTTMAAASYRVDCIRDLMRMEMPDRYTDIPDPFAVSPTDMPTTHSDPTNPLSPLIPIPSAAVAYRAKLRQLSSAPLLAYEGAKCLYLFVSLGLDDPDVMSLFNDDEISIDTRDGLRYFVDGWGQPIYFIRWAPGFSSPLQPWNVAPTDAVGNSITPVYPDSRAHDPFDPMHVYKPTPGDPFYNPDPTLPVTSQVYPPLFPLIFSAGPDRITDIYATSNSPPFQYSKTTPPNNPYEFVNGSWTRGGLFGVPADLSSDFTPTGVTIGDGVDNSTDNITNHDLSQN